MNLGDAKDALIDALRENGELRAQLKEARAALRDFAESFESAFVIGGIVVDDPGPWTPIVRLWQRARAALGEKANQ